MKRLGCTKDFVVPAVRGLLDGRTEPGGAPFSDFRVLLNIGVNDAGRPNRLHGWTKLGTENEDLHDQILGAQGYWAEAQSDVSVTGSGVSTVIDVDDGSWIAVGDVLTFEDHTLIVTASSALTVTVRNDGPTFAMVEGDSLIRVSDGQREAVSLLYPVSSSYNVRSLIACTRSRIYVNTGSSLSWRLLADGLGGEYQSGDSQYNTPRFEAAQIGDIVLFANGFNDVLAWPIGGEPVLGETDSYRRWSAYEVYDLQGLGITAASCVCGWNGFAFLGDVYVDGTRYASRLYWSDFNRPMEWAPGGESLAGYYDFGIGQKILKIATLGGTLRVYTDRSVYVGEYVGGDVVFRFTEIYSGEDALFYKWSFVDAGDSHFFLSRESMVEMRKYDAVPQRMEWYYKASGIIFNGLSSDTLNDFPVEFGPFGGIDAERCHQIAAGYNPSRRELWISWPATDGINEYDSQFEGVRRVTMMLSRKFGKASIVDHGFSAFSEWRPDRRMSVRDFTITYCVCDAPGTVLDKEGLPQNAPVAQCSGPQYGLYEGPDYIVNQYESGGYGVDIDSLCALIGDLRIEDLCPECTEAPRFIAFSLADLTIKDFDLTTFRREVYEYASDDAAVFPETSAGSYSYDGYPSCAQSEISNFGTEVEKYVDATLIDFVAKDATPTGQLRVHITTNNSPKCAQWHESDPVELSCLNDQADPDDDEEDNLRSAEAPSFAFYEAGIYAAYRFWLEGTPDQAGGDGPSSPIDCSSDFTTIRMRLRQRTQNWK